MIEDSLYAILTGNAALVQKVGTRIYPDSLPQNPKLPAVVYTCIGSYPVTIHDGIAVLERTQMQFDVYAISSRDAKMLIDTVRKAIESYRGTIGGHRIDTVLVLEHGVGDYDDVPNNYRRVSEFEIWHSI